jgi:tRNA (uracil-5-)-methyltransferase
VDCPNISTIACKYAAIFQEFLQLSDLPVWNRFKNCGFWRQLTVYFLDSVLKIMVMLIIFFRYFYYAFLTLSETNCFCKVREGRSNGNVVDGENFDGIAEVMLIVQVIYELFGECAGYYLYKNVVGITLLV